MNSSFLLLIFGRFFQALLSILTIKMMTHYLSVEEIGHQYIINAFILWFSFVLINPVGMFVNRHVHEWQKNSSLLLNFKKLNLYFFIISILSLLIVTALYITTSFFSSFSLFKIIFYFSFYVFFSTWFQTLTSMFNLFNQQKKFIILNNLSLFLGLCLAICGVLFYENSALIWLVGLLLGQIVSLFLGFYWFYKSQFFSFVQFENSIQINNNSCPSPFFSKQTFNYCYPVAITTLFMWFNSQGYRVLVEKTIGIEQLASLGLGLGLAASLSSILESVVSQYLYPVYYKEIAHSDLFNRSKAWLDLWEKASSIYLCTIFLFLPLSIIAVDFLLSKKFDGIYFVIFLGLGLELFRLLTNLTYLVAHAEKKTENNIKAYFWGSLVLLGSVFFMSYLNFLNVKTILFGLCISSLTVFAANYLSIQNISNVKISFARLFKLFIYNTPQVIFFYAILKYKENLFMTVFLVILTGIYYLFQLKTNSMLSLFQKNK